MSRAFSSAVVSWFVLSAIFCALSACTPAATSPATPGSSGSSGLEVPRFDKNATQADTSNSGVRFGRVTNVVGTRWSVSVYARSTANSSGSSPSAEISEYISEYSVEALEAIGPSPTRLRVLFEKNVQRYGGIDNATSIHGKSYVVQVNAPHVINSSSSSEAPEDETQRVLDVFPDLGTRTQIDQVLPDAAMAIGEERRELAAAILRVIHPRAWTLNKGDAVLARVDDKGSKDAAAVFTITLDAVSANGVRMNVKGEAHIRLSDAKLMSIAVEGSYDPRKDTKSAAQDDESGHFQLRRIVHDLSGQ